MNPTTRARLTVLVLCFGGLAVALTQTLVIPIQGDLPTLLDTSVANAGWVITITLLAAAVAMPISGRLADLYGKKRVLVVSTMLLIVGSVISALSSTLAPMLAGRTLQGLALGFIPVAITLMREVTPPKLTNSAVSAMSATLGVGGALGLPLAAWIAQSFDWHVLFWTSAGLAATLLAVVWFLVPNLRDAQGGRFDAVGAVGLALGLVLILIGVSKGHEWGWTSAPTVGCLAGGVLVLLVWGSYELRSSEPLVDLRTTARRPVLLTNLAAVAVGFGIMAQGIVVPQLMRLPEEAGGLGQSMAQAGLWLAPGGLTMMAFSPVSARLLTAIGGRLTLILGASVLGCGYIVAFSLMSSPWQLMLAAMVISAGVGIGYAAMPTLIMSNVPRSEAGAAVGLNTLMRSTGSTTAAAVMTTVLASSATPSGGASHHAYVLCFVIGCFAAFGGAVLAAFIPAAQRRTGKRAEPRPVAAAA